MMQKEPGSAPVKAGVCLEGLLDELADRIADRLAVRISQGAQRYADKDANPYGSARAFLDAARRGDFPTFKRARKVTAKWGDVEAAIESRRCPVRAVVASPDPDDLDRAELEAAGVRLCPVNDVTRGCRGARVAR
jgi:hypothetical protein